MSHKVVISTVGRFHLFALARELERRQMLERIYSGFTRGALARENLPPERLRTFPLVRPLLMLAGRSRVRWLSRVTDGLHRASLVSQDAFVARHMPAADIFVGHEGVGLWSGRRAQRQGAIYVCDRGCSHIGWKEDLMQAEYDRVGLKYPGRPPAINREIEEYAAADHIVVPSTFAKASFIERGHAPETISVVPYGVNLSMFAPAEERSSQHFEVLFVGQLSVRKGAHDLLAAFEALDHPAKRLTLVGTVAPDVGAALAARLQQPNVRVLGPVPQPKLKAHMGASHVLVLPSIEEGLALVQAEALACGCPIVSTTNTGALDLIDDGVEGFIVPIRSPQAIAEKLQFLADRPEAQAAMSEAAAARTQRMGGWREYGGAMIRTYLDLLGNSGRRVVGGHGASTS